MSKWLELHKTLTDPIRRIRSQVGIGNYNLYKYSKTIYSVIYVEWKQKLIYIRFSGGDSYHWGNWEYGFARRTNPVHKCTNDADNWNKVRESSPPCLCVTSEDWCTSYCNSYLLASLKSAQIFYKFIFSENVLLCECAGKNCSCKLAPDLDKLLASVF